ncbi:MAG TPA: trypsin-like serine protease [Candidatus Melainabacteria bacterium]|nr:trypsin-like serine protease [Candidatus Melainabacteria bacterium]HIN66099.1 trypsin-like serine protease [Candidatus Obscuribacterales bacterium]
MNEDDFELYKQELLMQVIGSRRARSKTSFMKTPIKGVAYGFKLTKGECTKEVSIQVFVARKLPKDHAKDFLVPKSINGLQTDVIPVGGFQASAVDPKTLVRPLKFGVSGGHFLTRGGTLGCQVEDPQGTKYVLSNNHVLADLNRATIGDPIIQQSSLHGGRAEDSSYVVAKLSKFIHLGFGGEAAYIDAAIAKLESGTTPPNILGIGSLAAASVAPYHGMTVKKSGCITGLTTGKISSSFGNMTVAYDDYQSLLRGQITIDNSSNFAAPGDSGSLIVDSNNNPVALLVAIASAGNVVVATPIDRVLNALGVTIVGY